MLRLPSCRRLPREDESQSQGRGESRSVEPVRRGPAGGSPRVPAAPQQTRGPTPSVATGEAGEPRPARLPGRLIRAAPAALTRALPGERLLWAQPCPATSGPVWHRDAPRLGRRHSGLRRPWRQWVSPLEAVGAPPSAPPHSGGLSFGGGGAATSPSALSHPQSAAEIPPPRAGELARFWRAVPCPPGPRAASDTHRWFQGHVPFTERLQAV